MPNAENATLEYEAGQTLTAFAKLTEGSDFKEHLSAGTIWSNRSGYSPDVKPNGIATGGVIGIAASGSDDVVDVTAATAYIAGVSTDIAAGSDLSITRSTSAAATYRINSITINSSGSLAAVVGAAGASHITTRGGEGGPPWIPTTSIEVGQVKTSSTGAAAIAATEIFQVIGTHRETYNFPTWDVDYVNVTNGVLGYAGITFHSALPQIHSDDAGVNDYGKAVYAQYYTPSFAQVPKAVDFVPPANSHSVSSTQIYGQTLGSTSSSIGQGSFTAYLEDGISDGLLSFEDETLWFRFKQNSLSTPYILCQGKLGLTKSFPSGDNISAACTISAESTHKNVTA